MINNGIMIRVEVWLTELVKARFVLVALAVTFDKTIGGHSHMHYSCTLGMVVDIYLGSQTNVLPLKVGPQEIGLVEKYQSKERRF